ncbi:arginine biosynthesis bifunctional protein ArgJ [Spirochaetia bacterium]|nr:arginine biosynthesis bifunctional protein ArgJ [Spirochaetia bacterium]GHU35325.1 arginine biosynthesis bifunctional protein ArgJ [Spirochaetia bacterium]
MTNSICTPAGFLAGGIFCGIKASSHKRDLALILSEKPCTAAAVFTTNRVKAASVLISQQHLEQSTIRAVIINSGNANACTGEAGMIAARTMAELVADEFAFPASNVIVASTGVIGVPLPIAAIESEIGALADSIRSDESGEEAALEAIMTTDTRRKSGSIELNLNGKPVRIGAMVKGSGMIHPNMATLLGFITTDAVISRTMLDTALRQAVKRSFNRLTIDGDTSTNDMVLIMANGMAGNIPLDSKGQDFDSFASGLETLCIRLAREMARDGEGATKLICVSVSGAESEDDASVLAKSVAGSALVKTAMFGSDANWGRVLCALGYAGLSFDPAATAVSFKSRAGSVPVCKNGESVAFSEESAKRILSEDEIDIEITVGTHSGRATVYGCDLSYDYVKINGDYRS